MTKFTLRLGLTSHQPSSRLKFTHTYTNRVHYHTTNSCIAITITPIYIHLSTKNVQQKSAQPPPAKKQGRSTNAGETKTSQKGLKEERYSLKTKDPEECQIKLQECLAL